MRVPAVRIASGPMFYAGAQLGLNTLGCCCWKRLENDEIGRFNHVFISRVAEKTAAFTLVLLEDLMKKVVESAQFAGCSKLTLLSDTGTHFRSYSTMTTYANQLMKQHRAPWNDHGLAEVAVFFGSESHFKNAADSLFSELRESMRQMSLKRDIEDDKQLVQAYRDWHEQSKAMDPTKTPCSFWLFEPKPAQPRGRVEHIQGIVATAQHTILPSVGFSFERHKEKGGDQQK